MLEGFIMNSIGKISVLHVIFISMTVIGLKNHVTVIPPLLAASGRDAWMSVLASAIVLLPWLLLLVYIHNHSKQQRMTEWIKNTIGPLWANILLWTLMIILVFIAALTLLETLMWVSTTFLPFTPTPWLILLFVVICMYLATTNIETIAIVNVLILFVVVVLGFFIAFTNIKVKDYGLLRPFFEHGWQPIAAGMVYPASGFVELILLLFIQHHFKDKLKFKHFVIMLVLLVGLTSGPLLGAIVEFGPTEAAKQRFPAFEEWGLGSLGEFIEHLDFFSIYQWLSGVFIRVGCILFVVIDLLNLQNQKKKVWGMLGPSVFAASFLVFYFRDFFFLENKMKYGLIASTIYFLLLSIVLGVVASISKNKEKKINRGEQYANK